MNIFQILILLIAIMIPLGLIVVILRQRAEIADLRGQISAWHDDYHARMLRR